MNLAIVGYGKMGRLVEQLAPSYGFAVPLHLDIDERHEGVTRHHVRVALRLLLQLAQRLQRALIVILEVLGLDGAGVAEPRAAAQTVIVPVAAVAVGRAAATILVLSTAGALTRRSSASTGPRVAATTSTRHARSARRR